jgi:hypothetical protein
MPYQHKGTQLFSLGYSQFLRQDCVGALVANLLHGTKQFAPSKKNSYLHTIATNLMQLMTARADPNQTSPTHYTSLRFIVGFGDYMFDNSMEWAKRHDPAFGANSYGNITRLRSQAFVRYEDTDGYYDRQRLHGMEDFAQIQGFHSCSQRRKRDG